MATKLHQILAVESKIRAQTQTDITAIDKMLQKAELLEGLYNEYAPIKEDGDKEPSQRKPLQVRVPDVIKEAKAILEKQYDITAIRDYANIRAIADVVVDGQTLIKDAPAPYLLWLEERMNDLHTMVSRMPTLPPDIQWIWDKDQNCYRNEHEIKTVRTAKVEYALTLVAPTKEHPGQAVPKVRDENVGYWTKMRYSGAIPVPEQKAMKDRVENLMKAVKLAREKANQVDVDDNLKVGGPLLKFVFGV
jgi:hypothetical protein